MALTEDSVASAIRAGRSAEELVEVRRILAYATEAIDRHAPDAPEATNGRGNDQAGAATSTTMPTISAGASVAHASTEQRRRLDAGAVPGAPRGLYCGRGLTRGGDGRATTRSHTCR